MNATTWEYRLRVPLYVLLVLIGYVPFWETWLGLTTKSTWLTASALIARQGWLNFQVATTVLLLIGILFTALAAWLRVWGTAYLGPGVVSSSSMTAETLVTRGPYRRTRNPLYLGTLLHTVGISILMPPAGAVFAIAAIWILELRLSLAEEAFLRRRFGSAYQEYAAHVPQMLPSPKTSIQVSGPAPNWVQALAGEIYMVGVVVTLLAFGWDFNAQPLIRGILISLGVALVLQAFLPRTQRQPADARA